jgi:quercetin dioxygenase-like cupin family protein
MAAQGKAAKEKSVPASNRKQSEAGAFSPGSAVDVGEAVAYQAGAIVSRTLIKRNGGTVTLFAFDKGQVLSEHTAPFDALVQVLDGEVEQPK